jgi:adenosylcobinamide kinase/adenosylcobinamide-phosphate guanylyltransferase
MAEPRLTLIGGGARSGKSAFALELARSRGLRRVLLATAEPLDAEMHARIAEHRRTRGADFTTIETPVGLPAALHALRDQDVAVVDCLTLWLSNLLLRGHSEADIVAQVDALAASVAECRCPVLIVTSEVGMGLVPESALGRAFRDIAGRAHQQLALVADEIYLAVLGIVLQLRPSPVALTQPQERPR